MDQYHGGAIAEIVVRQFDTIDQSMHVIVLLEYHMVTDWHSLSQSVYQCYIFV